MQSYTFKKYLVCEGKIVTHKDNGNMKIELEFMKQASQYF